jgi:trimeric autotransporter adhesin
MHSSQPRALAILFSGLFVLTAQSEEKPSSITGLSSTTVSGYAEHPAVETSTDRWQSGFVLPPGTDGTVWTLARIGNDVYVGGRFERAGGVLVNGLARWDGTNWHPVSGGVSGPSPFVAALAVAGTNLIVGGSFHRAGDVAATNLACWTGTEWRSIGHVSGQDLVFPSEPAVFSLLYTNESLFVAGRFRDVSGMAATNIARWDGTNWSALGNGLGPSAGVLYALAQFGAHLYAGGKFFDGSGATNIARWNGSKWLPLGKGIHGGPTAIRIDGLDYSGEVSALTPWRGRLWVGGSFYRAGTARVSNLARWTGKRWIGAGTRVQPEHRSAVHDLVPHGRSLYAIGTFERFGRVATTNIARFNGTSWKAVSPGINGHGVTALMHDDDLLVGGDFGMAGSVSAANIAHRKGSSWAALGEGRGNTILGYPTTIAAGEGRVYVAGALHTAGTNAVRNVAMWDGVTWQSPGGGIPDGVVTSSAMVGSNYYVAGYFSHSVARATNLACWDGNRWRGVGGGLWFGTRPGIIRSLSSDGRRLYVSGHFSQAGGVAVKNTAVWDGTNWEPLPQITVSEIDAGELLVGSPGRVFAVIPYSSAFIKSGAFELAGQHWEPLPLNAGLEFNGVLNSSAFVTGKLLVWGNFAVGGDLQATNLAAWNGVSWSNLGQPFDEQAFLTSAAGSAGVLFVGGMFTHAAGAPANSIARYDGTNWSPLGEGLQTEGRPGVVNGLAVMNGKVFATGMFKTAGRRASHGFAVGNDDD